MLLLPSAFLLLFAKSFFSNFYARFGAVAIIVAYATTYFLMFQITFDPSRPYFIQSLILVGTFPAVATYGFYAWLGD